MVIAVDPAAWVQPRAHETRLGQAVAVLTHDQLAHPDAYAAALANAYSAGQRVAVVGIPESIGPRANGGRAGSEGGWNAFLQSFLNLQATAAVPYHDVVLVGAVDCVALQHQADELNASDPADLNQLRNLCERLDHLVLKVITPILTAGFELVVVGGGHNNAYPLLTALAHHHQRRVGAVNFDPHADFRLREGRHSGNGFSYAYVEGALSHYHVMGLHEAKNSQTSLTQLSEAGFRYHSLHHLHDLNYTDALLDVVAKAASWQRAFGI